MQGSGGKTADTSCGFDPIRVPTSVPQRHAVIWKDSQAEGMFIYLQHSLVKTSVDHARLMWTFKSSTQEQLEQQEVFNTQLTLLERQMAKTDNELMAVKEDNLLKVNYLFSPLFFLE